MKLINKERALTAIVNEIRASHSEDTILVGESLEEIGLIKAFDVIRQLPTVEKRPRGRWQKWTIKHAGLPVQTCTECDFTVWVDEDFNYCPRCGADMREKQNEST